VDRGGPRESIIDGETGFLRMDDPDAFAQGMTRLFTMPPGQLDRIGARARLRAAAFSWDTVAARMDDHVDHLADAVRVPIRAQPIPEPIALAVGAPQ
jgi:glycosyltransferase involved in cell wall biosynthesis